MDLIQRKEMEVEYCPTKKMIANYMTKPTVGGKFVKFRDSIMDTGLPSWLASRSVLVKQLS
jgi:hypothetical protein